MLRIAAIASAGLIALAGCASTDEEPRDRNPFTDDVRLGERVDRICFGSQIDGFTNTTDNTVVVEAGVRDYYLIETFSFCPNLDFAQSLAFDRHGGCLTRGDAVIAFDSIFPSHGRGGLASRRCPIHAIYEWDPKAVKDEDSEGESEEDGEADEAKPADARAS